MLPHTHNCLCPTCATASEGTLVADTYQTDRCSLHALKLEFTGKTWLVHYRIQMDGSYPDWKPVTYDGRMWLTSWNERVEFWR